MGIPANIYGSRRNNPVFDIILCIEISVFEKAIVARLAVEAYGKTTITALKTIVKTGHLKNI